MKDLPHQASQLRSLKSIGESTLNKLLGSLLRLAKVWRGQVAGIQRGRRIQHSPPVHEEDALKEGLDEFGIAF